jgi:hypothetical protein
MSNFGDIDPTRFGFGSNKEQDEEPCFCWLHSRLTISIFGNDHPYVTKKGSLEIEASHRLKVFCSKDIQPTERFQANFIADNYVSIGWDIYKMCGACKETKPVVGQYFGCMAADELCYQSQVPGTFTSNYKKLWKLRSVLKQQETEVKGICKDIRKSFKKCKFDMACKQTKKVCEGSGKNY